MVTGVQAAAIYCNILDLTTACGILTQPINSKEEKMKRSLVLISIAAVALWATGCQTIFAPPSAEAIFEKMEKATDPGHKLPSMKTSVFTYNAESNNKEKSELVVSIKSPSQIRFEFKNAEGTDVIGYDGKTGWEYDPRCGMRTIAGKELEELKFQAVYLAPDSRIKDIFAKTMLNGSEMVDGEDCWKLTGYPLADFKVQPVIIFISKERSLLVKTIEQQNNIPDSAETVVTLFRNYKLLDGVMMPYTIVTESGDLVITSELTSVKWNPLLRNRLFAKP